MSGFSCDYEAGLPDGHRMTLRWHWCNQMIFNSHEGPPRGATTGNGPPRVTGHWEHQASSLHQGWPVHISPLGNQRYTCPLWWPKSREPAPASSAPPRPPGSRWLTWPRDTSSPLPRSGYHPEDRDHIQVYVAGKSVCGCVSAYKQPARDRRTEIDETEDGPLIRRGSVSVREMAGCPACLTLEMMGIEGKVDLPAWPQDIVLVHRESWWLEPGLRRVKGGKEDERRPVLRAVGLLSKVDTGGLRERRWEQ